ncbi:MAG TPA: YciI family protein [Polyangiaceae bacterium]|nr:YciI family protein [Polyangiaceae bacterium]
MKAVVIGVGAGASMETVMAVFPRHKAVVDTFVARGEVIGIGPFADRTGSMAIFRSREAAQAFVEQDPFILEGLIKSYEIREWADDMLT